MEKQAARFFENLSGRQVWVAGIGVANIPTIEALLSQNIAVTACDRRTRADIGEDVCSKLEEKGAALRLGSGYLDTLEPGAVLLRTPGMYYSLPALQDFRRHGGILTSEVEAFCDYCPCPLIAVTGSDGKTTTSSIIAKIMEEAGHTIHLGGNIGRAMLPILTEARPEDYAVTELSSFQLLSMRPTPQVSVVTNVAPNHLDVHGTMEEYIQCKREVFAHQNAFSRTVLSLDNEITASFAQDVRGECLLFSMEQPVENGAWYDASDGWIYTARYTKAARRLMRADEIRIPGLHNVANYLAAICAVQDLVEDNAIRKVAATFGGVEHRIEFVRELDGVHWYNDSIATSPTRVVAGLRAFPQKIIMIAGGYDKQIPFDPMAADIVQRVKCLILCGDTADAIRKVVESCPDYRPGSPQILLADDIPHAVRIAQEEAEPGDIISLSPACASFDRYKTFEHRGRHFKELVQALEPQNPQKG